MVLRLRQVRHFSPDRSVKVLTLKEGLLRENSFFFNLYIYGSWLSITKLQLFLSAYVDAGTLVRCLWSGVWGLTFHFAEQNRKRFLLDVDEGCAGLGPGRAARIDGVATTGRRFRL